MLSLEVVTMFMTQPFSTRVASLNGLYLAWLGSLTE